MYCFFRSTEIENIAKPVLLLTWINCTYSEHENSVSCRKVCLVKLPGDLLTYLKAAFSVKFSKHSKPPGKHSW